MKRDGLPSPGWVGDACVSFLVDQLTKPNNKNILSLTNTKHCNVTEVAREAIESRRGDCKIINTTRREQADTWGGIGAFSASLIPASTCPCCAGRSQPGALGVSLVPVRKTVDNCGLDSASVSPLFLPSPPPPTPTRGLIPAPVRRSLEKYRVLGCVMHTFFLPRFLREK